MKKRICQILTLLFTVSILTVSASASFSSCSQVKENFILKCLMSGQTTSLNTCISVIKNQPVQNASLMKQVCNETPKTETPVVNVPCKQTQTPPVAQPPKEETPNVETPVTEQPGTEVPKEETPDNSSNVPGISAYEARVIELVNDIRESNGLNALTANAELSNVARVKSQDMIDKHYFSHTSPTYGSPFDMMKTFGISYRTAGENIAYGYSTPESVVDGWMNSEGHKRNILNSSYKEIGVGYVSNGHYWTQMFIG